MKTLLVAEKESAALDFVKALNTYGDFKKVGRSYESDGYIVTWLQGHVISMKETKDYPNWEGSWSLDALPWYPPNMDFEYKVTEKNKKLFDMVKPILTRSDVGLIVCATDAGREGDLIFWELYDYLKLKKPVKRFFESAVLTPENVIRIMENDLKGEDFYEPMRKAAYARAYSDLLLGMNFTIGFTAKAGLLLNLGRVKTPTLAILANRRKEIDGFVKEAYYEVVADFNGEYKGTWFKEQLGNTKVDKKEIAEELKAKIQNKKGRIVKKEVVKAPEKHPLLYSLTSLQREASKKFDYAPNETLEIAQSLYDNHKILSYPRTDSEVIGDAHVEQLRPILETLTQVEEYKEFAEFAINDGVKTSKRFVNNKGLTDHHALIPTNVKPNINALNDREKKIYDLVVKRFLSVFHPDAIYEKTSVITEVEGETFKTNGRVEIQKGWKAIYNGAELDTGDEQDKEGNIPPVNEGEERDVSEVEMNEKFTSPPKLYTYDTLLGAMANPKKVLSSSENEEYGDIIEKFEAGLGTPATRANILEELINGGYVVKVKKNLDVTTLGAKLIEICPEELKSPIMTAEWEMKLLDMGKDKYEFDEFMDGIQDLIENNIEELRNKALNVSFANERGSKNSDAVEICKCKFCGEAVRQRGRAYICDSTTKESTCFIMGTEIAKKKIKEKNVQELMATGKTSKIEGFMSASKKKFDAFLVVDETTKKVAFSFESEKIGSCRKCGKDVVDAGKFYKCESHNTENKCFGVGKEIAGKKISPTIIKQLLIKESTDLIKGFTSTKGNKFDAKLKLEDGKVSFVFEEKKSSIVKHDDLKCPSCGNGTIQENDKSFGCTEWKSGCKFTVWKNGKVKITDIKKIIEVGETDLIKGMKGKNGDFDAVLKWNSQDKKVDMIFQK